MNSQLSATFDQAKDLPAPARAWALAKAAFEVAHEANFAEQAEAVRIATRYDPEPDAAADVKGWLAWSDRNQGKIDIATAPIVARYPNELKRLLKLAEANMVEWAEQCIKARYRERFAAVKPAFDAYRNGQLWGEKHDQFLKICFNVDAAERREG
jgi:hypothetical protein